MYVTIIVPVAMFVLFVCMHLTTRGVRNIVASNGDERNGLSTKNAIGQQHYQTPQYVQIPRSTSKPKSRFSTKALKKVAELITADMITGSLCNRTVNSVAVLYSEAEDAERMVDGFANLMLSEPRGITDPSEMTEAQRRGGLCHTEVTVNESEEPATWMQGTGNHVIVNVKPPLSRKKVLQVYIAGPDPDLTVEIRKVGPGPLDVVIFCPDGRGKPTVIAEGGVTVYFVGGKNACLSMMDGEAHLYGGCSSSGYNAQLVLHGKTTAVGGFDCTMHTSSAARVLSGEENGKCETIVHHRYLAIATG